MLPDGLKLERRKLRGEVSDGMILAEHELDLGTDHSGIMVLDDGPEPGTPLADVLPLGEDVLEVELTGNRPDLLSVYGIAREVAALFDGELAPLAGHRARRAPATSRSTSGSRTSRAARATSGGSSATSRSAESPPWLKARLRAAGMRSISNVVDVTNYVMLALGSPLHVFDFDTLRGGRIVVRRARPGEELRTLDGDGPQARAVRPRDRGRRARGRARRDHGRRGDRGVGDDDDVLLEAANFEPVGILRTLRAARAAHRGLEPLGEGRRPVPRRAGGGARDAS